VRVIEGNSIMIQGKGMQAVHVTPTLEIHSNCEIAWHSSIKILSSEGKLEGKLSTHYHIQPHQNSAYWNFIWKGELQCLSSIGVFNFSRIRGITQGKVVSTSTKGGSIDRANTRGNTRGTLTEATLIDAPSIEEAPEAQQLALHLGSHRSTLTFTLDTLAQHHTLINQLQDEFEFLRRQGENMEAKLEARPLNSSTQSQNEET
jgi:hypothetical protein